MERSTRRAVWIAAAALGILLLAWIGCGGSDGTDRAGETPVAKRPSRADRPKLPSSATPERRERVRLRPEAESEPEKLGETPPSQGRRGEIVDDGPIVVADASHAADPQVALSHNLRPAVLPGAPRRVVARNWTAAKETLPAASSGRPNLTVAVPAGTSGNADQPAPMDDDALALAKSHGLRGDYFDFLDGDIHDIPDLAKLPPTLTRIEPAVDYDTDASFELPFNPDTFAARWTGFLEVPEDGNYRFVVGSDDGARVRIDGAPVVDQPQLRPYAESDGAVKLTAGKHAFEVTFYENYGYASCRVWWTGPSWKRKLIEPRFFTPPAEFADVTPPVIASVSPDTSFVEDTVTIRGIGFAAASRVTFGNVPAEIVSASDRELVVKVPVGAATGGVVVQTGVLSSFPWRFVVKNLLGLYAEYFKLEGSIEQYPDYTRIAPYFVRLDPDLDFMDDSLWKLPYDPDVFASRHTGFLYAPEDDDYRITIGGDDGTRMLLDGKPYLDMPGVHGYAEQTRTTRLAKGFHAIEVDFFENYGLARLALYWQRATEPVRTVIPEGFFYAPRELSEMPVPHVDAVLTKSAEIGGEIEIKGSGFGADAKFVRVQFPGEVWVRPVSVADDDLRVRVPYGTTSGEIRVDVGIQSSNRAPLYVATAQGLVADYFTFADRAGLEANASPDALAKLTAAFTRTEVAWQRTATKDWDLPFPADAFAVHWHGTLALEYPTDVGWILRSAAGAWLYVDGVFTVDCGPWHELMERYGGSHLAPGEHRFDLWLVQAGSDPKVQLLYTPAGRLDHLPVPARWFLPREPRPGR